jgi:hypothetical protein
MVVAFKRISHTDFFLFWSVRRLAYTLFINYNSRKEFMNQKFMLGILITIIF